MPTTKMKKNSMHQSAEAKCMERTYVDLLTELKEAVDTDIMSEQDRQEINQYFNALYEILWKYSA